MSIKRSLQKGMLFGVLAVLILFAFAPAEAGLSPTVEAVRIQPSIVGEGNDYATQVLADAWDMGEFADISEYLNESGVVTHLDQIQVAGGIFSARTASSDPQFYTLFPGFQSAIDNYNDPYQLGSLFPIDPAKFHCFFTRMQVDSTSALDGMRVFWFGGNTLALGAFGVTRSIATPQNTWQIYQRDFNQDFDPLNGNTPWTGLTAWQGLRIDPTGTVGVNFAVDWMRLTDCQPVNVDIGGLPTSGTVTLWAGIDRAAKDFPIKSMPGGVYTTTIDVQGWEPGRYYIGVESSIGGIKWSASPLTIDPAPRVEILSPADYSADSLRWEMDSLSDIVTDAPISSRCVEYFAQDGLLHLTTLPPSQLPNDCKTDIGGGLVISDPQIVLSMPIELIDTKAYRYLVIRTYMEGELQDINRGWVLRWLWQTYDNNDPSQWCINVSNDIPFSPGWQTIIVDLHDPVSGLSEDAVGLGNCAPRHWTANPTDWLRLDVNENTNEYPFHQLIDYIRLIPPQRIRQAETYPIKISSSETLLPASLRVYYTTDPADPYQAQAEIQAPYALPLSGFNVFLPAAFMTSSGSPSTAGDSQSLKWIVDGVPPGEYFICIEIDDGYNQYVKCSLEPIIVTAAGAG